MLHTSCCRQYLGGGKLFVAEFFFLLFFSYVMIKLRMDGTTFITTYCFLAGAMYNYWEKNINRYQHCIVFVVVVFLLLLTTTLLALSAPIFKGYAAFGALVWTVCFIFLYTKMNVQYNKVFDHLKRISYDVFLCQGIAFYLLEEKAGVEDHLLYAVLSIILSVAFGETCYYVRQIAWHKKIDSERFTNL